MKKFLFAITVLMLLSSCCTLFTPTRQTITFVGENGTKIYDNGIKIAEIKEDNVAYAKIKKSLSSKELLAKKEGYIPSPLRLEATVDAVTILNLLFWPGILVDAGTGKMCKWENTYIEIEMDKK